MQRKNTKALTQGWILLLSIAKETVKRSLKKTDASFPHAAQAKSNWILWSDIDE